MGSGDLMLRNARLLNQAGLFDVSVQSGVIHSINTAKEHTDVIRPISEVVVGSYDEVASPGHLRTFSPTGAHGFHGDVWDLEGRLLLPGFVDIHTHLDKALTLPFTDNPDGTLGGAIAGFQSYEPQMTSEDVLKRTLAVAKSALMHGTTTIRTHVNYGADGGLFERSLEGLKEARRQLRGLIDLQFVVMCPMKEHPSALTILERGAADHLVAIGGASHLSATPRVNLAWIVSLAKHFGLTVDLHADEQLNPQARTLGDLAELVRDWYPPSPVVAGHCVSLDVIPAAEAVRLAQDVAESRIGVVTLPGANLFLQGRDDETGVRRGLTRVKLLQQSGVLVAAASDNIQDVFHPYGRGDLLEAALLTAYAAHFRPEDASVALSMVSVVPGRLAVDPKYGVHPGQVADLVVLDATNPLRVLQTMSPGRWVFKAGRCVASRTATTRLVDEVFQLDSVAD